MDFSHLELSQAAGAAAAEQVSLLLMMAMFGGEFMGPIAGATDGSGGDSDEDGPWRGWEILAISEVLF